MANPRLILTLAVGVSFLFTIESHATLKKSVSSGNWSNPAIWSPLGVPTTSEDVTIQTSHIVTIDKNTASVGILMIDSGAVLQGDGTGRYLSIGAGGGQDFYNSGTLDFAGTHYAILKLNTHSQWGTTTGIIKLDLLDLNGNVLSFVAGASLQIQFTGSGNCIANAGTINGISTALFNYSGTSPQLLSTSANVNYGTLWINNSAGVSQSRSLSNTDLVGDLIIQSGTFNTGGYSITGNTSRTLQVVNGATLNVDISGAMATGFGTKTFGTTSTVNYTGTIQTVSVENYGNLTLSGSGTKTLPGSAMTISGDLTTTGTVTATTGGALTVNGNLSIGSGTTFNAGSFIHTVLGTWSNTGTLSAGTSTVAMNGSSAQTLSGGPFYNLTVNNTSGVSLSSDVSVTNTLTLTSGTVTTGASTLTLGTSTSVRGTLVRTSGSVLGNFRRWFAASTVSNVLLPVASSSNYRPASVSFTGAPSAGGTITASFTGAIPGTLGLPLDDGGTSITNASVDGYWTLTAGNGLTGGTYSLDLTADGFFGVNDFSTLRILKRTNGSSTWTLNGTHSAGTGSNSTPVAHRTGMSGFSQFGIGGAGDNPLPIQLAYFNAVASTNQQDVDLTWATVSETNNFGFTVQQRVGDAGEFVDVPNSFVAGHGTTLEPQEYSWIHQNVAPGSYYYRLKQVDLDGTTHFTESVFVPVDPLAGVIEEAPREFSLQQNYPNPFNPSTTIQFTVKTNGYATLQVFNTLGQVVATPFAGEANAGHYYSVDLNASGLSSGNYFYKLTTEKNTAVRRMLLMK